MDDQKESRAGLAVVVAVLILTLVGPFIVTVWTAALLKTTMRNGCAAVSLDSNGVGQGGQGYTVVSYNLRGAQLSAASGGMGAHKGDYAWSKRGPIAAQFLANINPDLVGLQEANKPPSGKRQLAVVAEALPGISWVYADHAIPIGYRAAAFALLDHGRVQLNWAGRGGATSARWAVWVKLRATADGSVFFFVNLHSQYMQLKAQAKARSAGWSRLVAALHKINAGNRLPTVMVGDFNASSTETRPIFRDHLTKLSAAGFVEAAATGTNIAPIARVSSYNGWGDTIGGKWFYKAINRNSDGSHIDYVWTAGKVTSTTWQVYTGPSVTWRTIKGQQVPFAPFIPSDHWPVVAHVAVGASAPSSTAVSGGDLSLTTNGTAVSAGAGSLPPAGQPRQQSLTSPAIDIPAAIKALYVAAAARYAIPWQLLAGIGMAETRHGANNTTSSAGAQGLMQFMPGTFASFGVDGDRDGRTDIHSDADSIYSAANYLVASGARKGGQGVIKALWAYNHSISYRNDVLFYAASYAAGSGQPAASSDGCPMMSSLTELDATATGEWADVIAFALSKVGIYPYSWGGGTLDGPSFGTDSGAGIRGFDCSSFVRFVVYQRTKIVLPRDSRSQARFFSGRGVVTRTNNWRDLKAGDIVFFSRGSSIGSIYHVALVTKPGWIVEEPGRGRFVQHNPMERRMPGDIWGYARVSLSSLKGQN